MGELAHHGSLSDMVIDKPSSEPGGENSFLQDCWHEFIWDRDSLSVKIV